MQYKLSRPNSQAEERIRIRPSVAIVSRAQCAQGSLASSASRFPGAISNWDMLGSSHAHAAWPLALPLEGRCSKPRKEGCWTSSGDRSWSGR